MVSILAAFQTPFLGVLLGCVKSSMTPNGKKEIYRVETVETEEGWMAEVFE